MEGEVGRKRGKWKRGGEDVEMRRNEEEEVEE